MKYSALNHVFKYMAPDEGAGSGGTSTGDGTKTGDTSGTKTEGGTGTEKDKETTGDASGKSGTQTGEKTFTQKELDSIISERLKQEKEKQERVSKEKQGEFQKLYDEVKPKYESTTQELESFKAENEALKTQINSVIDSQIKDWPEAVKILDPGANNILVRQKWVEQAKVLVEKLGTSSEAPAGENGDKKSTGKEVSLVDKYMTKRYATDGIPGAITQKS